eukprot:11655273-Heterocapsa_arctica.AAC.1
MGQRLRASGAGKKHETVQQLRVVTGSTGPMGRAAPPSAGTRVQAVNRAADSGQLATPTTAAAAKP